MDRATGVETISEGDEIEFLPQYRDRGDEKWKFIVLEVRGDRLLIQVANSPMRLKPTQTVKTDWCRKKL
jgi:hypothetical protein